MNKTQAIKRLHQIIRRRHMSLATEQSYTGWVSRFADFLARSGPLPTPAQRMEAFLTRLATSGCAASTQNQAFNAILFFYREVLGTDPGKVNALRARRPAQIRSAPSVGEVGALLSRVQDVGGYPTRLLVRMLYGMGLRVSEPLALRVKDVLLAESRLVIRGAKGGKDRVVSIPCALATELQAQLRFARGVAERDRAAGLPIKLPGLLATKYPRAPFSPAWAWLFPAHEPCIDPRSGLRVRWHCHPVNVQRCVRTAARPLGLDITPHHLRHAYATHCLNRGVNLKALQSAMGHAHAETTLGYCHAEACSVASPLDMLAPSL
jgi:site-specific recombinase XerD